jgi:hypothetical protein
MRKSQERLPFEYEAVEDDGSVTSYGGLPLVCDTMRALGVTSAAQKHIDMNKRSRLFDEATMVESFVLLFAAGGDCLDDFSILKEDKALCRLLGRELPSPEAARKFLYAFHDDALVQQAQQQLPAHEVAAVPEENPPLQGLAAVNTELLHAVIAKGKSKIATIDIDATIQESNKREAQPHYEGGRGYQPVVAYLCEEDLIIADEFRDGNVPAGKDTVRITKRALDALPSGLAEIRLRADSAFYNTEELKLLVERGVQFCISADMSKPLVALCKKVPEHDWQPLETRTRETVHVAEVAFAPGQWPKSAPPLRYLAVRFTPTQGEMFETGAGPKYLAVVTNRAGDAASLLRWHWEKAGTIEQIHDVVKNELGGGVLPCGRFGANAAYFRLVLLTYNVLSALKSIGLPPRLHNARPKRLRFEVLVIPAVVVSHARRLLARVMNRVDRATQLIAARHRLWPATAT